MEDPNNLLDHGEDEGAHDEASASKLLSSISDLYHDGNGGRRGGSGSNGNYMRQGESLPLRDSNIQSGSKLALEDILPTISDAALRKSSKQQQKSNKKGDDESRPRASEKEKKKSNKGTLGKLDAPVSRIRQDKVNRQQAFEGSKETLGKWMPTVKRMRDAEHLSFPLAGQPSLVPKAKRAKQMINSNSTNNNNNNNTSSDGAHDEVSNNLKDINRIALSMEKDELGDEEKRSQIARLRLARELMFREEVKAKRQKKIKSKTYRRIKKKEREQSKMYVEMLAREMEGAAGGGDLEEDDDDEELGGGGDDDSYANDRAISVSDLQNSDASRLWRAKNGTTVGDNRPSKLNITEGEENGENDSDADRPDVANASSEVVVVDNEEEEEHEQDKQEPETTILEASRPRVFQDGFGNSSLQKTGSKASSSASVLPLKGKRIPDKEKKPSQARDNKRRQKEKKQDNDEDGHISFNFNASSKPPSNPWLVSSGARDDDQSEPDEIAGAVAFEISKESTSKPLLIDKDANAARRAEQAGLVQRAFAGDDVVADFMKSDSEDDAAKASLTKDDGLPGWGSWTGLESKRRENIKNAKLKKQNAKGKNGASNAGVNKKQKKQKLEKVKVNNKVNKKQVKYSATTLPHPFESKQQYERSLRVPIGPEWATKEIFRKSTTPRVLVKHSSVIQAISHPIS